MQGILGAFQLDHSNIFSFKRRNMIENRYLKKLELRLKKSGFDEKEVEDVIKKSKEKNLKRMLV